MKNNVYCIASGKPAKDEDLIVSKVKPVNYIKLGIDSDGCLCVVETDMDMQDVLKPCYELINKVQTGELDD